VFSLLGGRAGRGAGRQKLTRGYYWVLSPDMSGHVRTQWTNPQSCQSAPSAGEDQISNLRSAKRKVAQPLTPIVPPVPGAKTIITNTIRLYLAR
jgi:hypothetical protein